MKNTLSDFYVTTTDISVNQAAAEAEGGAVAALQL